MSLLLLRLWKDQSGEDLAEYALCAVVVTAVLFALKLTGIHAHDLVALN